MKSKLAYKNGIIVAFLEVIYFVLCRIALWVCFHWGCYCAGNWVQIRPPKQSQNAIRRNTILVSSLQCNPKIVSKRPLLPATFSSSKWLLRFGPKGGSVVDLGNKENLQVGESIKNPASHVPLKNIKSSYGVIFC